MEQIADFIGRENLGDAMVIMCLVAMAFVYTFGCESYFRERKPMSDNIQKVVVTKQGIGFCGLLFIILLLLKVGVVETAVMGWSWWWITAPLWGPAALVLVVLTIFGVVALAIFLVGLLIAAIVTAVNNRKKAKLAAEQQTAREARQNKGA